MVFCSIAETKHATNNDDCKPPAPSAYSDIPLPLEMRLSSPPPPPTSQATRGSGDRPILRATCDISAGHIWGPYRTAGMFSSNSQSKMNNTAATVHRQITVLVGMVV